MPLIVEKRIFPLLAMHLSTHFGLLSVRMTQRQTHA
jgi:hypothetical protein